MAPLNVKKKEVQTLFPLLAKWWKQAAFCAFGRLSAVFLFWRAHRWSEVKDKFMVALGTAVLSTFTWSLHALQAACNPVTLSSSVSKTPCIQNEATFHREVAVTSTDPRLWAKCWTHKCKKKKKSVFTFTVPYVSTCVCTCASYIFASIYIDQRKARFHKNKARVGIQFFVFKLCRKNMT